MKYVSPAFHAKLRKSQLTPGDVVIVRTGYPGTAAVVPASLPSANCADLVIARPGPRLNARFLAYVLNSPWGKSAVRGRLVGVAQQHFNVGVAQELQIPLPPRTTQDCIAFILGAYDDLIEVNGRRIALLEQMARHLFEEWFVHFRFPGHELQRGAKLPRGWKRVPIEQVYEGLYDGPHATPKPSDDGPIFLGIGNIRESGGLDLSSVRRISDDEFPAWTRRVTPRAGDIVFTYEATLNRYAMIPPAFGVAWGADLR